MIQAVVGLGNPGPRFDLTRHNAGFMAADALVDAYGGSLLEYRMREQAEITIHDQRILVVKPLTYMNDVGRICPVLRKMGISPQHMLVLHDDLELSFGTVTYKAGGSAAGHNGLRSLIQQCGAQFPRIRIGVGRPEKQDVSKYVLGRFSPQEQQELSQIMDKVVDEIQRRVVAQH